MSDAAPHELPNEQEVAACLKVLQTLVRNPGLCEAGGPRLAEVRQQAARLLQAGRERQRREARDRDRELLDAAGIRAGTTAADTATTAPAVLSEPRSCYVCKQPFARVHLFYDALCPACADLNYQKRQQHADLSRLVALVTGGRVKIGFQVVLKLLRAGATVATTTRFPCDAARRFAREPDFPTWQDRLRLHAIDLRDLAAVDRLADGLAAGLGRLDIVINNAAQTVRRPPAFYRHLLDGENGTVDALPVPTRRLIARAHSSVALAGAGQDATPALLTQLALLPGDETHDPAHFPPGWFDADGQQIDLRTRNSWALELGDVAPVELLETHAVNCLAPFLMLRRLEPLLFRADGSGKYVVNVSAMEGQLNAAYKTGRHPHTNMAKAALNMITRTCAESYARRGVYMNSVDTGWVTNEAPKPTAARMAAEGFREPLDVIDGAARVLDPVFVGLTTGRNEFGQFLKDYRSIPW